MNVYVLFIVYISGAHCGTYLRIFQSSTALWKVNKYWKKGENVFFNDIIVDVYYVSLGNELLMLTVNTIRHINWLYVWLYVWR